MLALKIVMMKMITMFLSDAVVSLKKSHNDKEGNLLVGENLMLV